MLPLSHAVLSAWAWPQWRMRVQDDVHCCSRARLADRCKIMLRHEAWATSTFRGNLVRYARPGLPSASPTGVYPRRYDGEMHDISRPCRAFCRVTQIQAGCGCSEGTACFGVDDATVPSRLPSTWSKRCRQDAAQSGIYGARQNCQVWKETCGASSTDYCWQDDSCMIRDVYRELIGTPLFNLRSTARDALAAGMPEGRMAREATTNQASSPRSHTDEHGRADLGTWIATSARAWVTVAGCERPAFDKLALRSARAGCC